jgi:hypothetical protein
MKLTCDGCKHYRGDGHYNSYEFLAYCHDCVRYQAKDKWEPAEPKSLDDICKVHLYKCKDAEDT